MMGKTKKFTAERFLAICDFIMSLNADGCREHRNWSRSIDYLACVSYQKYLSRVQINSLVEEGLLKKTTMRKGEGVQSEELVQTCYKCNFDQNFFEDVAAKIDFKVNEYLFDGNEAN